ncbi:MAG TPA: metallophosphoesterase [Polyangiaceae bacterium]|jgi:hypothetical protein|nr:metallophosphoesterase [Polyangiaceae bacterium]
MMDFHSDPYIAEQQIRAVVYCLVAFAYIDSDFALSEKEFIRDYLHRLADGRARKALGDDIPRDDIVGKWTKHYHEVLEEYDESIRSNFTESVAEGETTQQFVLARLKLGCFELLRHFDDNGQRQILDTVLELMHADGVVQPQEQAFIDEIIELIHKPIELDDADIEDVEAGSVIVQEAQNLSPKVPNHPWFNRFEWDYARDKATFDIQSATDMDLVDDVRALFDKQREKGAGKLAGKQHFNELEGEDPFLDGYVYVAHPKRGRDYELLVIGDLHGCYSCLKAALLQADVLSKVQKSIDDPKAPMMYVVLLGDYIDRGRFSYSGTLRTVLQLFLNMPNNVFVLRGNHEFYVELRGRVVAPVRPCEAMDSIANVADNAVFKKYMELFQSMPSMLVFGDVLFVHAGIPRTDTFELKYKDLSSLNDPELRFQMMWSDPSEADVVPVELQRENARFPFGQKQFQHFMAKVGLKTMVRGHERIKSGMAKIYDDPKGMLVSLFSAGGATNDDLPTSSNYRQVTPVALTIRYAGGVINMQPFVIDYERYNDPKYNAFFKAS